MKLFNEMELKAIAIRDEVDYQSVVKAAKLFCSYVGKEMQGKDIKEHYAMKNILIASQKTLDEDFIGAVDAFIDRNSAPAKLVNSKTVRRCKKCDKPTADSSYYWCKRHITDGIDDDGNLIYYQL